MTMSNTGNAVLNAMLSGATWAQNPGTSANVTYSFMTSAPTSDEPVVGFQPLSAADQAIVSSALPAFSAVTNITFTLVPNGENADIMFGLDNQTGTDGLTYDFYGSTYGVLTGAHVYFSDNDPYDGDVTNFWLTLHELGNATGLRDFSGLPVSEDVAIGLPAADADFDYTVMANNEPPHGDPAATGPFTATPALLDIQALQYLYGANQTGFTAGATSTAGGLVYSFTDNSAPQCIWVGDAVGGQTTFDFSGCDGTTIINLNAGTFSSTAITPAGYSVAADVGTPYDNVSIAYGTVIREAIAGNGGSTIIGNNAGDTLVGGTGNDTFYVDGGTFASGTGGNTTIIGGGGGADTVVFHDAEADYTINKDANGWTIVTETGGTREDGITTCTGVATFQFADASMTNPVPGFAAFDTTTGQALPSAVQAYTGPVSGLQNEYINITTDSLNISVSTPNWFIHSGAGNDAIAVSSGTNVLDGGTGSNFLTGGSGTDTFFVDDRGPAADIWSTANNFHAGDAATIWGITPQDFDLTWVDGQGAAGYTGLTLHATASGEPTASLTLVGFTSADLTNGRLTVSFGTTAATGGVPGSAYMYVYDNN